MGNINLLSFISINKSFDYLCNILDKNTFTFEEYSSDEFIKLIISYDDPIEFRFLMNILEKNAPIEIYEDAYRKKINSKLNKFDGNFFPEYKQFLDMVSITPFNEINLNNYKNLFFGKTFSRVKEYISSNSINKLEIYIKNICNRMVTDYISEYLFKDNFNNVLVDIEQILNYPRKLLFIDINKLNFYKEIASLEKLSINDRIKFFNKHKNSNLVSDFYDDIRKLKDDANSYICKSIVKLNKQTLNNNKSKQYGVPIYYYNGEQFSGIFRVTSRRTDSNSDTEAHLFSKRNYAYSFSYADSSHFWLYSNPTEFLTLFYDDIDSKNIIHVSNTDSFSEAIHEEARVSYYPNEITSVDRLLNDKNGYNELVIKTNGYLKPSAIVLFDTTHEEKILEKELEKYKNIGYGNQIKYRLEMLRNGRNNAILYAKQYNIPIMLINIKKYNIKFMGAIDDPVISPERRPGNYLTDPRQITIYGFESRRY